jgi:hypothetical protein
LFNFCYFLLLLFLSNDTHKKKCERIDSRPDLSRSNQRVCSTTTTTVINRNSSYFSWKIPPKQFRDKNKTSVSYTEQKKKQQTKQNRRVFSFFFVWISILRDPNFSCDNPMRIIITEFYKGSRFFLFTGFALLNYGPPFNNNLKKNGRHSRMKRIDQSHTHTWWI